MSYCINPHCQNPDRSDNQLAHCKSCGTELILNHRYRVQRPLTNTEAAASGFGYIYEILEGSQSKILKVLLYHHNNNPKAVELFKQEADVLQQLRSPSIPKIDGYFAHKIQNGMPLHCIVMEKIDGVTLEQWMRQQRNEPISQTKALDWLEEIVQILALVHSKNYFHRDIKPANIMLRRSGELVLIDFGTARDMTGSYLQKLGKGNLTGISSAGFTPNEQKEGQAVIQSDFFALGRTFAQLLTAKHPLDMYVPATDEFRWKEHTQNVSPVVLGLLDKMMARRLSDRHKDTAELLKGIDNARKNFKLHRSSGFSRRDLFLLAGSGLGTVVAWEYFKPKSQSPIIVKSPTPSPIPESIPEPTQAPISSQNLPEKSTSPPTAVSRLKTQTLNNIITVDASGKVINRRSVQVQYFVEDKISLPSDAKAIEMALIPAGKFRMGMPSQEKQIVLESALKHDINWGDVNVDQSTPIQNINFAKAFYVSRYAVTQVQWFAVMGRDYDKDGFKKRFGKLYNKFKGDNRPMVSVSWNDAKAYCSKLSELTSRSYRLPTESEWEYSCRAKTTTPFYFGETITSDLVNHHGTYPYANAADGNYRQVTTDVGSFPPNEWGLYDMHGNTEEWCEDVWHENYNGIPQDGSAWLNSGDQQDRLRPLRGGDWDSLASKCRSAKRSGYPVTAAYETIGFRVAASVLS